MREGYLARMNTELSAKAKLLALPGGLQKSLIILDLQHHGVDRWLQSAQSRRMRELRSGVGQYRLVGVPLVVQIERIVAAAESHPPNSTIGGGNFFRCFHPRRRLNDGHYIQRSHRQALLSLSRG